MVAKHKPLRSYAKYFGLISFVILFTIGGYLLLSSILAETKEPAYDNPQPERRFALLGHLHGQFTGDEYESLSTNYARVIINKLHGRTISDSHDAAKELKHRNPSLKIEIYWNAKYWYTTNTTRWLETGFDPVALEPCADANKINGLCDSWYLRDVNDQLIAQHNKDEESGVNENAYYWDLTNEGLKEWMLEVMQHWMHVASYDGIHFDSGSDLADGFDGYKWSRVIGADKMSAYNTGMKDLFIRTHQLAGVREVTFNGFSPGAFRAGTRSLEKLAYTDGATDEFFCLNGSGITDPDAIKADIKIMQDYSAKFMMLHSSYRTNLPAEGAPAVGRFCHAAFLMGWQPDSTFHKFAIGNYGSGTLAYDQSPVLLPELSLNLGHPAGPHKSSGDLLWRYFDKGVVYINLGSTDASTTLPFDVRHVENGVNLANYNKNSSYTIKAKSAAYFLNNDQVSDDGNGDSNAGVTDGSSNNDSSIESASDIPGSLQQTLSSPSSLKSLYNTTQDKRLLVIFIVILACLGGVLLTPIVLILDRIGVLNPLKFAYGKLKAKLLPLRWLKR